MPQACRTASEWFVKVINEVIKGLANDYLGGDIVFDPNPVACVLNTNELCKGLRKHSIKLWPPT